MDMRALYERGVSITEIARRFGVNWKTAAKWVKGSPTSRYERRPKGSILDPFKDYIILRMDEGCENAAVLLDELRKQGYKGGKTILKDFMQPRRRQKVSRATERFETEPGEQAQVDWASFGRYYDENGIQRPLYAFLMVMCYSRKLYVEFTNSMDMGTWLACHVRAFEYFGGVPRRILYDNLKAAVERRDENGEPVFNKRFLDFSNYYGFEIWPCKIRRAQTKGKVERPVRYLEGNFWVRKTTIFNSIWEANILAWRWLAEVANQRVHGTTHEIPNERFEKEREHLLPIEGVPRFDVAIYEERKVSRDFYVTYKTNCYSVSPRYAGRHVTLRIDDDELTILYDGRVIEEYRLLKGRYKTITRTEHREEARRMRHAEKRPMKKAKRTTTPPVVELRDLSVYESLVEEG